MYKMNLQLFGEGIPINLLDFCYAELDEATGTYGTPVVIEGAMEADMDLKTEEAKLSGDGKVRIIVYREGDTGLKIGLNKVPMKDQAVFFGRTYDADKGTLIMAAGDSGKSKYVACGFRIENEDGTSAYVWLYKGKFKQFQNKYKQVEDGKVTFNTPTIEGTFIYDQNGQKGIIMDESEGQNPPANFLSAVYKVSSDTTPPTVTSVPIDAATGVATSANVVLTFNKSILESTINSDNIYLMKSDGTAVATAITANDDNTVVTVDPVAALSAGAYILIASTGIKSAASGTKMASNFVVNFTV